MNYTHMQIHAEIYKYGDIHKEKSKCNKEFICKL